MHSLATDLRYVLVSVLAASSGFAQSSLSEWDVDEVHVSCMPSEQVL